MDSEIAKPSEASQDTAIVHALASPLDRLAAWIIDISIVLMPLIFLAVSPFRRKLTESMLLGDEAQTLSSVLAIIALAFLFIWIYQALAISVKGRTLGMKFFHVRVVNFHTGEKPTIGSSLLRASAFCIEMLFFLPLFSVFSHHLRRSPHDRLADTIVIAEKKGVSQPSLVEKSIVQGMFAAFLAFIAILVLGVGISIYSSMTNQAYLLGVLERKGQLCNSIGEATKAWPKEHVSTKAERLNVALTLYAAGQISKSCLEDEADFLSTQIDYEEPLLYLAQSFVYSDDSKLSNRYLDRVCKDNEKSEACIMSQVINAWSEEKWDEVDKLFLSIRDEATLHVGVWTIRHFMKQARFQEVLNYMDMLGSQRVLGSFLTMQKVKAFWNLGRYAEARAQASGSMDLLETFESVEMSAWLCQEEIDQHCSQASSLSCTTFDRHIEAKKDFLKEPKIAMTRAQELACRGDVEKDFDILLSSISEDVKSEVLSGYIKALRLYEKGEVKKAKKAMHAVVKQEDENVSSLAVRRLIDWADSASEIKDDEHRWRENEDHAHFDKIGRSLFSKYYELGQFTKASEIGGQIARRTPVESRFYRRLVLSSYHGGRRKEAAHWLRLYQSVAQNEVIDRLPASESEFEVISRLLGKSEEP